MRGVSLLGQFASHKQAQALVAVPFTEGQARRDAVVGRYAQSRVGGLHCVDFQRGQTAQGGQQLVADVVGLHARQTLQRRQRAFQQPGGLLQAGEFG